MNKEGLNTGFALKKEQEIGCANSIPALGTKGSNTNVLFPFFIYRNCELKYCR